jgi:hypothetical protein
VALRVISYDIANYVERLLEIVEIVAAKREFSQCYVYTIRADREHDGKYRAHEFGTFIRRAIRVHISFVGLSAKGGGNFNVDRNRGRLRFRSQRGLRLRWICECRTFFVVMQVCLRQKRSEDLGTDEDSRAFGLESGLHRAMVVIDVLFIELSNAALRPYAGRFVLREG